MDFSKVPGLHKVILLEGMGYKYFDLQEEEANLLLSENIEDYSICPKTFDIIVTWKKPVEVISITVNIDNK